MVAQSERKLKRVRRRCSRTGVSHGSVPRLPVSGQLPTVLREGLFVSLPTREEMRRSPAAGPVLSPTSPGMSSQRASHCQALHARKFAQSDPFLTCGAPDGGVNSRLSTGCRSAVDPAMQVTAYAGRDHTPATQSSEYFLLLPLALCTGYFAALSSIFSAAA